MVWPLDRCRGRGSSFAASRFSNDSVFVVRYIGWQYDVVLCMSVKGSTIGVDSLRRRPRNSQLHNTGTLTGDWTAKVCGDPQHHQLRGGFDW